MIPPAVLKQGKELTAILGLSGEEAGKLILNFQKQGAGVKEIDEMFRAGAKEARAYGLPVNEVLRDLGQSPEVLARFGVANRKEFAVATAKARSYGLTLKDVNGAFGDQLDTFEGSATAAAKLNTMFGTTINSFELMLETDPTKRMEMLRKELIAQNKPWEKLSKFEQNVVASTLNVDKATAQLILSSDKERKSLEAKAKQRESQIALDERWNAGMGSIKKTLIAWGPLLDKLMREASNFIVKLFGGDSASSTVKNTASVAENAVKSITKAIGDAAQNIDLYREFWLSLSEPFDSSSAEDLISLINKQNKSLEEQRTVKKLLEREDIRSIAQVKLRTKGLSNDQSNDMLNKAGKIASLMDSKMSKFDNMSASQLMDKNVQKEVQLINQEAEAVAAPKSVNDAFISKDGKLTEISEDDHIMVRKDMSNVNDSGNNDDVVKAINLLTSQITKMMSKGGGDVVVNLDGKEIARTIISNSRK